MIKRTVLFLLIAFIVFTVSCKGQNNNQINNKEKTSDVSVNEENIFDNRPLKILIHRKYHNYGVPIVYGQINIKNSGYKV